MNDVGDGVDVDDVFSRDEQQGEEVAGSDMIEPQGFGWPCSTNTDCISELCVEGPNGNICTRLCSLDCPEDFVCSGIANSRPDTTFICIPKFGKVCSPCTSDSQCAGGQCIETADGKFCTVACTADECPQPFRCTVRESDGASFCLPTSGNCLCRQADVGVKRLCQITSEANTCYGYETCDPLVGFVGCDARTPSAEICNGIDDDCNGKFDDGLTDGSECEVANSLGICKGINVCLGPQGLKCSALEPIEEKCNGIDDDCNGDTDEPFRINDVYATLTNCGACNRSCEGLFPNAIPACDATGAAPRCVVASCDNGFFKLNEFQCIPLSSLICTPCLADTDCIRDGSRCIPVGTDGGSFCGQSCVSNDDCPFSFKCLPAAGGPDQCQPESGTCSCTGATQDVSRGCSVSYSAPGKPSYTCFGLQSCQTGGWGNCILPAETCDGMDNNCDGSIDEIFVEPGTNRYIDDRNCGVCGNNCVALQVLNGHGVCDTTRTIPDCKIVCNDGFFDVDANPANGCECQFHAEPDVVGGGDTDCDGIDGSIARGVFVAKSGSDTNTGTIDSPLATITAGLLMATPSGRSDVYVATGVYPEAVLLKAGVGLYGGYSADYRIRAPHSYETVILGQTPTTDLPGAVNAVGVKDGVPSSTALDGFVIYGASNRVPGGNSIAVYLRDCDASVAVAGNRMVGGQGGTGQPGAPGAAGGSGGSGGVGLAAKDAGQASCGAAQYNAGGTAGVGTCGGTGVSGGTGGTAVCPIWDEVHPTCPSSVSQTPTAVEIGQNGLNNTGAPGTGGSAGYDSFMAAYDSYVRVGSRCLADGNSRSCGLCTVPDQSKQGGNGIQGASGINGPGGSPCGGAGTIVNGQWIPGAAGSGASGLHGGGGGGGGAAGGVQNFDCSIYAELGFSDIGGSGGGGGAGGCGAAGGTSGGSGGGSFGVFVSFSTPPTSVPSIVDSIVDLGVGGDGGSGGNGGVGGGGGSGGVGGRDGAGPSSTFCADAGGVGGNGGAGGHGGGGGGGCGGPVYGLFVDGAPAGLTDAYKASGILYSGAGSGGTGGFGGGSLGVPGTDGTAGIAAQSNL